MMVRPIPSKVAKLLPMLGSATDHEALAAARAIGRILTGSGLGFTDLAAAIPAESFNVDNIHVERPSPRPFDAYAWKRAYTPRQEAEHRARVRFCQERPGRLTNGNRASSPAWRGCTATCRSAKATASPASWIGSDGRAVAHDGQPTPPASERDMLASMARHVEAASETARRVRRINRRLRQRNFYLERTPTGYCITTGTARCARPWTCRCARPKPGRQSMSRKGGAAHVEPSTRRIPPARRPSN